MKLLGTNLTEDYYPIIDMIDKIAKETKQSRSNVVRNILCEKLQFTPEKKAHSYNTFKRKSTKAE